jgi:hypothetical protein
MNVYSSFVPTAEIAKNAMKTMAFLGMGGLRGARRGSDCLK